MCAIKVYKIYVKNSNFSQERNIILLTVRPCDNNEFRCGNGDCISEDYINDGDLDCQDGSDESMNTKKLNYEKYFKLILEWTKT